MGKAEDLGDRDETPRADGDDLEDAEDVVDRRVVGSLFVAIVEPMQAREEHPERKARDEEHDLPRRPDVVDSLRRRDQREGEDESDEQPGDVGDEEEATHEPPTAACNAWEDVPTLSDGTVARCDGDAISRCCLQRHPPLHARLPTMRPYIPRSPG